MEEPIPAQPRPLVYRHRLFTRLWHWINAIAVFVMLMSGLMIFNAHPRLYWGEYGTNFDKPWLSIGATADSGFLAIEGLSIPTTGLLGRWTDKNGDIQTKAFPGWATIPSYYSLSAARRWHLAFAWVLAIGAGLYWLISLLNRHIVKDLLPNPGEIAPRHIWHDIKQHARLRFPAGEAALRYNILQKLAYMGVLLILLPLMILTGLTMSPAIDAAWPWLLDLFGGRQSARSIHFIAASLIVAFIIVHLLMVLLAGPYNEIRSMITGRYRLPAERNS